MNKKILVLATGLLAIMMLSLAGCGMSQKDKEQSERDSLEAVRKDSLLKARQDSVRAVELDVANAKRVSIDDKALGLRQYVRKITGIVIHCSATGDDYDYPIDSIQKAHRYRGFRAIGYHFYITKDGVVHKARSLKIKGAHAAGHNMYTIGVCYEGGLRLASKVKGMDTITVPERWKDARYACYQAKVGSDTLVITVIHSKPYVACDTRTRAQKAAIDSLLSHLRRIYPNVVVCGHRDFSRDRNHDGIISPRERIKDCPSFDAFPEYN